MGLILRRSSREIARLVLEALGGSDTNRSKEDPPAISSAVGPLTPNPPKRAADPSSKTSSDEILPRVWSVQRATSDKRKSIPLRHPMSFGREEKG